MVEPGWFIWFYGLTTHFKVLFNAFEKIYKACFAIIYGAPSKIDPAYSTVPQKHSKVKKNYRFTKNLLILGFLINLALLKAFWGTVGYAGSILEGSATK